ncbi:MAG: hypothetical protein IPH89_07890 [Bacteroidetes bacterium]|jgi:hypothetical protein|nr:hypothetical protein [Bacteroidota bacterium]
MKKTVQILGIVSLILGILAAVVSFLPYGLMIGIMIGFVGMIISTIYIFLDMKHEVNTKKITPGLIGMFLSSVPVLIILGITIYNKMNM